MNENTENTDWEKNTSRRRSSLRPRAWRRDVGFGRARGVRGGAREVFEARGGGRAGVPVARVSSRVAPIDVVTRDAFGRSSRERARARGRARVRSERARGGGSRFARAAASSSSDTDARAEDAPPPPKPPPFEIPAAPPALLRVPDPPAPSEPDDDDVTDESVETGGFSLKTFFRAKKREEAPRGVRARDIIKETARLTFRDFGSTVVFALVAGAAAQTINLGGTFVLAVAGVHEVELVAALFLVAVQLAKAAAQAAVRVATFRNARDVDCGDVSARARANPRNAWAAIESAFRTWKYVLLVDARRLASIAWNAFLTIPIPYLALVKACDYALCVPVFLFEGAHGKECLRRSEELMRGHRLRLLRAALGMGALMSAAVGVGGGGHVAASRACRRCRWRRKTRIRGRRGGRRARPGTPHGHLHRHGVRQGLDVGSPAKSGPPSRCSRSPSWGRSRFRRRRGSCCTCSTEKPPRADAAAAAPEEAAAEGEGDAAPGPVRAFFRWRSGRRWRRGTSLRRWREDGGVEPRGSEPGEETGEA